MVCRPHSHGPSSARLPQDGDRLPPRTPVKDTNRDRRLEENKQELDKQRQMEKNAKIERETEKFVTENVFQQELQEAIARQGQSFASYMS